MNFSSMEYFAALARERSFTKAARRLHITQQSLSSHIASLEKELGCQLVVRKTPLELTFAGEALLRHAQTLLKDIDALQREFCDISDNQRGVLRIGVASTRGRVVMPVIVRSFQNSYPNIRVELVEATNDELQQNLIDGKTDLAIARFPKSIAGVSLHSFYEEEVILLVPRNLMDPSSGNPDAPSPQTIEEQGLKALEGMPFVLGNSEDIAGSIGRSLLREAAIKPKVVALSENAGTILSLCALGTGACFCPRNLAEATLTDDQLARLQAFDLPHGARYRIQFGCKEGSYQWHALDEFMRIAKLAYPSSLPEGRIRSIRPIGSRSASDGKAPIGS